MSLQIQMIGTGSAFAKTYYNNNALVYTKHFTLLIDCGATAPRALNELQIPLPNIDAILISHIHADHVGGLEELAFQYMYNFKRRTKLFVPAALEVPLWEHSLRGGLENIAEGIHKLSDYFDVIPLPEREPVAIHPELTIELLPTEHIPHKPSYGFLLNERVYYSADSRLNGTLLTELFEKRGCEHFLHECQLGGSNIVHATLDELLTLPEALQRNVLLMHYGDNMTDFIGKTGWMRFIEQFKTYEFK
ncbi:MBL fold metallo-hydrolase [Paenibacillus cremeus]|uniref:Ribonuclease Z n=1 Tax=Paenibacillus cremeus TaxID=2163881 RepID=A0A559K3L8_9BACL|nr:MBL fold metallo-hydrolase [Paenibacillus cremeus]TVY06728.1 ribonuclease Z [Paenibacillus cremeus]